MKFELEMIQQLLLMAVKILNQGALKNVETELYFKIKDNILFLEKEIRERLEKTAEGRVYKAYTDKNGEKVVVLYDNSNKGGNAHQAYSTFRRYEKICDL